MLTTCLTFAYTQGWITSQGDQTSGMMPKSFKVFPLVCATEYMGICTSKALYQLT